MNRISYFQKKWDHVFRNWNLLIISLVTQNFFLFSQFCNYTIQTTPDNKRPATILNIGLFEDLKRALSSGKGVKKILWHIWFHRELLINAKKY